MFFGHALSLLFAVEERGPAADHIPLYFGHGGVREFFGWVAKWFVLIGLEILDVCEWHQRRLCLAARGTFGRFFVGKLTR